MMKLDFAWRRLGAIADVLATSSNFNKGVSGYSRKFQ